MASSGGYGRARRSPSGKWGSEPLSSRPFFGVCSSAVDDVGRYLQSHPVAPSRLKILSWGFQSNLYVGSGGSVHGSELFWGATKARSSRGNTWESEIRDGGSFLLFSFPTGSA